MQRKKLTESFLQYSLLSSNDDKTSKLLTESSAPMSEEFLVQLGDDAIKKNKTKTLVVLLTKQGLSHPIWLSHMTKVLVEDQFHDAVDKMKQLFSDPLVRTAILDHVNLAAMNPSNDMLKFLARTLLENFDGHHRKLYEAWFKSNKHQAILGESISSFLIASSCSVVKGLQIISMLSAFYGERLPDGYKRMRAKMHVMLGEHHKAETLLLNLNKSVEASLLLTQNALHDAEASPEKIFEYHKSLGAIFTQGAPHFQLNVNDKTPDRKLNIGIVIDPFYDHHVVHCFINPILTADAKDYQLTIYDCSTKPNERTIQSAQQQHHQVIRANEFKPEQLVTQIRQDKIDVLFDLSGYFSEQSLTLRIPTYAAHPAPVQVTYVAYPNTLALPSMNYRLVDGVTDPEQKTDRFYTEKLLRLENSFLCYAPPQEILDAKVESISHSTKEDYVALGILNDPRKFSDSYLKDISDMLKQIPNSKLCFQYGKVWADQETCQYFFDKIQKLSGIAPEDLVKRINFYPSVDNRIEWISQHIDIAVDTYPYNGTTTNFDMLLACVPIVTHTMESRHEANVTASLLTHLALPELLPCITANSHDFVESVANLAENVALRDSLRAENRLREQLFSQPVGNVEKFRDSFWRSIRQTWHLFCESDLKSQLQLVNRQQWDGLTDEKFCARVQEQFATLTPDKIEEFYQVGLFAILDNHVQAVVNVFQKLPNDYQNDIVETLVSLNAKTLMQELMKSPVATQFSDALKRLNISEDVMQDSGMSMTKR